MTEDNGRLTPPNLKRLRSATDTNGTGAKPSSHRYNCMVISKLEFRNSINEFDFCRVEIKVAEGCPRSGIRGDITQSDPHFLRMP